MLEYLSQALAPTITRHGGLLDIYGEGVLITGDSGVGKSETAIELIKRGHRLVADDAVDIRRVADQITATSTMVARFRPGWTGMVMMGMSMPRMLTVSSGGNQWTERIYSGFLRNTAKNSGSPPAGTSSCNLSDIIHAISSFGQSILFKPSYSSLKDFSRLHLP